MAKQTINIGAAPNDGTGTPLRTSFDYCNQNFTELYTATGPSGNNIVVPGSATITGNLTLSAGTVNGVGYLNASKVLTAGSALVFDGTNLGVGGTGQLRFATSGGAIGDNSIGTENSFSMMLRCGRGSTSNIEIASDKLVFGVAATEQMRLNATGLGVGVASPATRLHVIKSGAGIQDNVYFENSQAAAADVGSRVSILGVGSVAMATFESGWNGAANTDSYLVLRTRGSGAVTERLRIDSSGNVGVGVTPSGSGGCLQLKSGITFPATQVASSDANTLDDYEEGTFTPTIVGTSAAGTGTYTTQLGNYTKIGRIVTCDISLVWTAHTGTGNIDIGGLPFSVLTTSGYSASAVIGYIENVALTAGNIPIAVLWWFNTTKIRLNQTPTGGGAAAGIPMDTAGQINLSITYIVA